jgi:aminoethylphosphonate catabolism LysR family transcriptional regulator
MIVSLGENAMNITGLRAFHLVAEAGSFTRAASAAGLSQPTLSAQVRLLERQHDAVLFDRRSRKVVLTTVGQRLFDVTARLFAAEAEARGLLQGVRTQARGHLRIAADSAAHVLPVLAAMKAAGAAPTFNLSIGNSSEVMQRLFEHVADIGVMSRPTSDPRVHSRLIRADSLVLFAPKAHPFARSSEANLADLHGQPVVIRERGSVTREMFERLLAQSKVAPSQLIEVEGREAVREAVAAGFGIGVVFAAELGDDHAMRRIAIRKADVAVAEYAVCLAQRLRLPVVRAFFDAAERLTPSRP